jgi:hypothetical protein
MPKSPARGHRKDGLVDLRFIPKIVYRLLTREDADGQAWQIAHSDAGKRADTKEPLIEIDSSLSGLRRLDAHTHEAMHLACPWMFETPLRTASWFVSRVLWRAGYRHKDEHEA